MWGSIKASDGVLTSDSTVQGQLPMLTTALLSDTDFLRICTNLNKDKQRNPNDNYSMSELLDEAARLIFCITGENNPSKTLKIEIAGLLASMGYTNDPINDTEKQIQSNKNELIAKNRGNFLSRNEVASLIAQSLSRKQ